MWHPRRRRIPLLGRRGSAALCWRYSGRAGHYGDYQTFWQDHSNWADIDGSYFACGLTNGGEMRCFDHYFGDEGANVQS